MSAARIVVITAIIAAVVISNEPRPGLHGTGLVVSAFLAALVVATVGYLLARAYAPRLTPVALVAASLIGTGMAVAVDGAIGTSIPIVVVWLAVARERLWVGAALLAFGVATAVAVWPMTGGTARSVAFDVGTYVLSAVFAYLMRLSRQAKERERETRDQVAAAQERTAVLDERARIAREIHDILAHTLSAQSVQLEGVRLLLRHDAPSTQVLERVDAAQRLTREGMEETRRALHALRGDTQPVAETLTELAGDAGAEFRVEGEARPLPAEVELAIFRTAQEAFTNVRKHAPGAAVRMSLRFDKASCLLEIADDGGEDAVAHGAGDAVTHGADDAVTHGAGDLSAAGSGYGLMGLRERAELLDGSLTAEPGGGGFVVRLRLPG